MARPTSFRLPEDLLKRLDDEASSRGTSVTALVAAVLDEGLKSSRFPGIVYRDGPTGRRAGLVGGPDVWEVIRDLKKTAGSTERRIEVLAEEVGVPAPRIRLALDFYVVFPEEIDTRVAANEHSARRVRELADGRDRLLGG